jgi:hypothetical protein
MVSAAASDADMGDTLTYAWSPAANFANPAAAATSYTCTAAGLQTLTLTVTDSHQPPCSTSKNLQVTCSPIAECGDLIIDPLFEQCDPPDGLGCDATCHFILPPQVCTTCEMDGTTTGACAGTSVPGSGTSTANFGCLGLPPGEQQAACMSLAACLRGTACQDAIRSATPDYGEASDVPPFDRPAPCLCGNIPFATCAAMTSGWTGVCAYQYENAAAADGINLTPSFADNRFAVGIANNLLACDIDNACQSTCRISP